jgi:hypothetical protein
MGEAGLRTAWYSQSPGAVTQTEPSKGVPKLTQGTSAFVIKGMDYFLGIYGISSIVFILGVRESRSPE